MSCDPHRITSMFGPAAQVGVALCAFGSPVGANGFPTEFATGGIVARHSTTVSIASEELYLSAKEIRVGYVFSSAAKAPERVRIGFPLPAIDPGDALSHQSDGPNYIDFTVEVDGKRLAPQSRQIAIRPPKDGVPAPPQPEDVTAQLAAIGIGPDFRRTEVRAAIRALTKDAARPLQEDGLLSEGPDPDAWQPLWRLQTLFDWEQEFKLGRTKVDIRYVPLTGIEEGGPDEWFTPENRVKYCPDNGIIAAATRWEKTSITAPISLTYILTTATYWNGPIGRFRLVVDKGMPGAILSFCPAEAKKVSPTRFEWAASSFVPTRDVSVLIFPQQ